MSYRRVDSGRAVILKTLLFDGNTAQFPLAHVYNPDGSEVAGSPFALSHVSLGRYRADGPVLPEGECEAVYITYSDAGHTTESPNYDRVSDDLDVRPRDIVVEESVLLVDEDSEQVVMVDEDPEDIILIEEC